jgi:HEAT repeat protein
MVPDDKESSGIVCAVSRQAGSVAGTSVVISKKIAGCGVKTVVAAKDLITQPLRIFGPIKGRKSKATEKESVGESKDEQETTRKKTAKALIASLEADLAVAQCEFKKALSDAEKTQSKLASQLDEPKVAQQNNKLMAKTKGKKSFWTVHKAVTEEQIHKAVFPSATDKIIFTKTLSDIDSQDAVVRLDAVKTIAGIRHELSVQALVAHIASESSAQVRQECIKALVELDMHQALPAVERALEDEAGSVRLAAVWALYHLARIESVPALIRMFSDENEEVRRRAATCIGWLGKKIFAIELLPLLDDSSVSVRKAAVQAMGNLGNRQVVSSLIEQLNDPVDSIRKAVLSSLETITGKKMSKSFPKGKKEFERLIARWQEWRKEEIFV